MTKTQICNLALTHLGGRLLTDVDTETSQEAILCRTWFDIVREEILREHIWNFATKRSALSGATDLTTTSLSGYDYQYLIPLPADYIRIVKVEDVESEFNVEYDGIYCDYANPLVRYVYDNTTYTTWPKNVIAAFSYLLASYIAQGLTGPAGAAVQLRELYNRTIAKAKRYDSYESREKIVDKDEYSEIIRFRQQDMFS
jgi:hypothetical protein